MGFTGLALAFALALAVPASIAPASLIGAYVVIAVLAGAAAALAYQRRRSLLPGIGVAVIGYAAVATLIHLAA